jgi:fructose/tagatose bisphosphate aldolase
MYDASRLDYADNLAATRSAADWAHAGGPDLTDPRKYLRPARDRVADTVAGVLRIISGG